MIKAAAQFKHRLYVYIYIYICKIGAIFHDTALLQHSHMYHSTSFTYFISVTQSYNQPAVSGHTDKPALSDLYRVKTIYHYKSLVFLFIIGYSSYYLAKAMAQATTVQAFMLLILKQGKS